MFDKIYRFYPAAVGEKVVYGSARPGTGLFPAGKNEVNWWLDFVKRKGIQRVCVLLTDEELLRYYNIDLLNLYVKAFGNGRVCHAPVADLSVVPPDLMKYKIIPFLTIGDNIKERVVVHCNNGLSRTGQVMAAWLVQGRGWKPDLALKEVEKIRGSFKDLMFDKEGFNKLIKTITGVRW